MRRRSRWIKRITLFTLITLLGSVALGVSAKAQENYDYVVTAAQYGVDATDNKSDSDAINTLLKRAIGADEMVTFYFPAGKYYISSTLKIYSNTHLILHEDAVIYRMDSLINKNMLRNADQNGKKDAIGGYDMSKNIIVEGGTWDGGNIKKATDATVLLRIDHAENVTIKDCFIKNVYDCHLITYVGVKNGLITNCELTGFRYKKGKEKNYNYAREAIQLESAWTDNESNLKDKSSWWAQGTVIDGTSCQNVSVTNNVLTDMPCGIGQHHHTKSGKYRNKDITISDNVFKCSSKMKYCKTAITCGGMNNLTVTGNTINGPYRYAMRIDGSKDVLVENNDIKKISKNGIIVEDAQKVTIRNNTLKNISSTGISINDGQVDEVTGNTIDVAGRHGIFAGVCNVTSITDNKISDTKQNGMCFSSSTITKVANNTIKKVNKHGISVTGSNKKGNINSIENNTISDTKINGIAFNGGKLTNLLKNKITGAKGHGINVISGTVGKGKQSDKGIQENELKNCKKNGISVGNTATVSGISGNKVSKITKHGISISQKAKVYWVTNNTIKNCKQKGINITTTKAKPKVKKNKGQTT